MSKDCVINASGMLATAGGVGRGMGVRAAARSGRGELWGGGRRRMRRWERGGCMILWRGLTVCWEHVEHYSKSNRWGGRKAATCPEKRRSTNEREVGEARRCSCCSYISLAPFLLHSPTGRAGYIALVTHDTLSLFFAFFSLFFPVCNFLEKKVNTSDF